MKCLVCGTDGPTLAPGSKGRKCRSCQQAYQRAWYHENKEKHKQRAARHRVRWRASVEDYVLTYLLSHPCADCGETDPIVLQFDHVRGDKVSAIGTMLHQKRSLDVIKAEVAKWTKVVQESGIKPET